jgi:hypothetical protein
MLKLSTLGLAAVLTALVALRPLDVVKDSNRPLVAVLAGDVDRTRFDRSDRFEDTIVLKTILCR